MERQRHIHHRGTEDSAVIFVVVKTIKPKTSYSPPFDKLMAGKGVCLRKSYGKTGNECRGMKRVFHLRNIKVKEHNSLKSITPIALFEEHHDSGVIRSTDA